MERSAGADPQELLSHSRWLRTLARHLVESPDQADDLVQDTLRKALESAPSPAAPDSGLRAWLARAMRNLAINRRRDEGARDWHERAASRSESWTPEDIEERVRLQRTMADAVLGLEEPYRSVITLHYFEGIAPREIARRQGISYDATRQRIARGLGMLRARLDRENGGDRAAWSVLFARVLERGEPQPLPLAPILGGGLLMSASTKVLVAAGIVLTLGAVLLWGSVRTQAEDPASPPVAVAAGSLSEPTQEDERSALSSIERTAVPETTPSAAIDRDLDLHGEVVDPAGAPVIGAKVEVFRNPSSEYNDLDTTRTYERRRVAETESGAEGRFAVRLEAGRPVDLEVSAGRFARERIGTRYAGERVLVRMHHAASIEGQVRRASDRKSIPGANLRLWPAGREKPPARFRLEGVTDGEGGFRFDDLAPAEYFLEVTTLSEAPSGWRRIDLAEGERREIEIAVEAGPTIRGRVLDATTQSPISNSEVGAGWTMQRPVRTNSGGEYEYIGFPLTGFYDLHVRAPGYGRTERVVRKSDEAGFPERIDFELFPARSAHGRVVDAEGAPIPEAKVAAVSYERVERRLDWVTAVTSPEGRFELQDLRPDMLHTLFVRREGFGTVVYDFPAEETAGTTVEIGEVVLAPMSVLKGLVADESGHGIPDQTVQLYGWNSDRTSPPGGSARRKEARMFGEGADIYVGQRQARTDDLGRFTFADLSAGKYNVNTERRGASRRIEQEVEIPRASVAEGIRLVLPGGGTIEGRVIDPAGDPVPKGMVHADPEDPSSGDRAYAETDREGRFVLRHVRPGTYRVRAEASHWSHDPGARVTLAPAEIPGIEPGQRNLELVLRPGAWLQGRVLFPDGSPVERVQVVGTLVGSDVRRYASTDESGRFQVLVAADDLVDLEARPYWTVSPGTDLRESKASRVSAGGNEIILRLPARP